MSGNILIDKGLFKTGRLELAPAKGKTWTLAACGDFRVNKEAHPLLKKKSYPAAEVRGWLESDIVIANLEAPVITGAQTKKSTANLLSKRYPPLAVPECVLDRASEMGITHFTLANNHIKDFGARGILETIAEVKKRGFALFGAGKNIAAAAGYHLQKIDGVKIAFGGYAQNENTAPAKSEGGANLLEPERLLADVAKMKRQADLVILFLHDGYEFSDVPRAEFFRLCRRAAKAGAGAIFCHHPHVPHGVELVNGVPIFYSLGNFLFRMKPHTGTEWALKSFVPRLTFSGKKLCAIELMPVRLDENFVPRPSLGAERSKTLRHLEKLSLMLNEKTIDEANRVFIKRHVWDVVLDCIYEAGKNNDKHMLEFFKSTQMFKDPYLKAMKDGARLFVRHENFGEF
jgi:hypothetical protein